MNCWRSISTTGTKPSIRSTRNTRTEGGELLRRLHRFRKVIERPDDVTGERLGERGRIPGVAHKADVAARQFRKAFGRGEDAHAGTQARFRQYRYCEAGEYCSGNGARVRARVKQPIRPSH